MQESPSFKIQYWERANVILGAADNDGDYDGDDNYDNYDGDADYDLYQDYESWVHLAKFT